MSDSNGGTDGECVDVCLVNGGASKDILSSLYDIDSGPSLLHIRRLEDEVAAARQENAQVHAALAATRQSLERSQKRVTKLTAVCATLVRNMSSLYVTAHNQIERKKLELESWKRR